jgi:hypothetical protein
MSAMKNIHMDTEVERLRAALDQAVMTGQAAYAELEAETERLKTDQRKCVEANIELCRTIGELREENRRLRQENTAHLAVIEGYRTVIASTPRNGK